MTVVIIMTSIDRRERITPFGILGRYLAQYRIYDVFSHCPHIIFPLLTLCIPCILARSDFFFCCCSETLPLALLTLWHFECVQECKVCMGVIIEIWLTPLHFLHFLHFGVLKMRIMQKMRVIPLIFLFAATFNLGSFSIIYAPHTEPNQNS